MSRIGWHKATRQEEGRTGERSVLRAIKARRHPMSGAGSIKQDGSDEEYVYELKDTVVGSYTLRATELMKSFRLAVREGKEPIWIITFRGDGLSVVVSIVPD